MIKIVTHDSSFHTDDIFAVATLLEFLGEGEVIRSRDLEKINSADYVVDVGLVYNPELKRFDHHQVGGAGARENGIQYASFGLVWKEFGQKLSGGEREAELIDRELVQPIDAHDNGMAIAEYKFKGVREYTIGDFFSSHITKEDVGADRLHEIFMDLVRIARELLRREIVKARDAIQGEDLLIKIYQASVDKRLIEIPDDSLPWRQIFGNLPEPIFVLYPGRDKKWRIKAVPDFSKPYGNERKNLPASWGGKVDKELQDITGVPDAIFAHRGLFMAAAESKEGALELAKKALNA